MNTPEKLFITTRGINSQTEIKNSAGEPCRGIRRIVLEFDADEVVAMARVVFYTDETDGVIGQYYAVDIEKNFEFALNRVENNVRRFIP